MLVQLVLSVGGEQHQVLDAVVRRVAIDVMHHFRAQQGPVEASRYDQAVLHDVPILAGHAGELGRTAHVLDGRIVPALAKVGDATFPSRVVRAAHLLAVAALAVLCPGGAALVGVLRQLLAAQSAVAAS